VEIQHEGGGSNTTPPGTGQAAASKNRSSRDTMASIGPPSADASLQEAGNRFLLSVSAIEPGAYPCRFFLYPIGSAVPDFRMHEIEAEVRRVA
jgi:hypothetical protein